MSIRTFVKGSVVINSEYGIDGLFCFPITAENNLATIPTTNTSVSPVTIATGRIDTKEIFLFFGSLLKSLFSKLNVLLCIILINHRYDYLF